MPTTYWAFPAQTFTAWDTNGDPVPSAKASIFEAGTSTPLTTYTDTALTTPHAVPQIADANGVFAPMYISGADEIKIDVTDADDVQLPGYPVDNITGIPVGGLTASGVVFDPTATLASVDVQAALEALDTLTDSTLQPLDATLTSLAAVAGVAGDILYASGTDAWARLAKDTNGMFLKQVSGLPAWVTTPGITRETAIATTSGTAHGFTGIAAGANRITFMLDGVSFTGGDKPELQIGDSGGYETATYKSSASNGGSQANSTSAYSISEVGVSSYVWNGIITLTRIDGNTWESSGIIETGTSSLKPNFSSGSKTLTGELDRIQIIGGTFDAGKVNIFVE